MRRFIPVALFGLAGCITGPESKPVAVLEVSATTGRVPFTATFNASKSHWTGESEGNYYDWYAGEGPAFAGGPVVQYTYVKVGQYKACVTFGVVEHADRACVIITALP